MAQFPLPVELIPNFKVLILILFVPILRSDRVTEIPQKVKFHQG